MTGDGGTSEVSADDERGKAGSHPLDDVVDRPAASAGAGVAAVVTAAAFLPWTDAAPLVPSVAGAGSTVAAIAGAIAAITFLVRRHGFVDRRIGAAIAGVASAVVVFAALVRFVAPEALGNEPPAVGPGLPLAAGAALLATGLAVAEYHDIPASGILERLRRFVVGFGLLVAVFFVASLVGIPVAGMDLDLIAGRVARTVLFDAVLVGVVLLFLVQTGRGIGFIDVNWPGKRDLAYAIAGFVALSVGWFVIVVLVSVLGLPSTDNQIVQGAEQQPELLLVLIPLQFLAVAPAEELFNRNLLQKYFYGTFSRPAAIVVASGLFSSAHLFSYLGPSGSSAAGTLVSISTVLVLGLVLGAVYERTDNVVVPTLAHGAYNASLFALYYLFLTTDVGGQAVLLPW